MNLLGHNYIAFKTVGHLSPKTLLGSHIPDFVPFLPSSVFSFDENHEKFLEFIRESYPDMQDLPLSMMCHSVKYGADEYNREIDEWLLGNNESLIGKLSTMIAKSSNISYETARGPRLHNYLWCGVDLYLIKNNLEKITAKLAKALDNINYTETAKVLAEFYSKDQREVENNLKAHFKYVKPQTFQNIESFTLFWSKFLSPLKEGNNLDIAEGSELLEFIYQTFETSWEEIIDRVEVKVRKKMKPYL